jgi:hypothetical protein
VQAIEENNLAFYNFYTFGSGSSDESLNMNQRNKKKPRDGASFAK